MAMDNAVLSLCAGVYEGDNGQLRIITVSENQLHSQLGRGAKAIVHAYQKDKFFFEDNVFQTIEFKRNAAGEVKDLVLKSREGIEVWKKAEASLVPPPANGNGHDDGFKELMKQCVQESVDIVKDINTIPWQNEDVRSIALTMFIPRARVS